MSDKPDRMDWKKCSMELETEINQLRAALALAREALHKLACLGNGAHYGTSDGNRIAQVALAEIDAAMKEKP